MNRPRNVFSRDAESVQATPYGEVGVLYEGTDLAAWWIWKDDEEVEPAPSVVDAEDLLVVVRGSLRLELAGHEPIVLAAGDCFVIPPNTPFRGYRWPRDGDPCLFVAVSPRSATFTRSD